MSWGLTRLAIHFLLVWGQTAYLNSFIFLNLKLSEDEQTVNSTYENTALENDSNNLYVKNCNNASDNNSTIYANYGEISRLKVFFLKFISSLNFKLLDVLYLSISFLVGSGRSLLFEGGCKPRVLPASKGNPPNFENRDSRMLAIT